MNPTQNDFFHPCVSKDREHSWTNRVRPGGHSLKHCKNPGCRFSIKKLIKGKESQNRKRDRGVIKETARRKKKRVTTGPKESKIAEPDSSEKMVIEDNLSAKENQINAEFVDKQQSTFLLPMFEEDVTLCKESIKFSEDTAPERIQLPEYSHKRPSLLPDKYNHISYRLYCPEYSPPTISNAPTMEQQRQETLERTVLIPEKSDTLSDLHPTNLTVRTLDSHLYYTEVPPIAHQRSFPQRTQLDIGTTFTPENTIGGSGSENDRQEVSSSCWKLEKCFFSVLLILCLMVFIALTIMRTYPQVPLLDDKPGNIYTFSTEHSPFLNHTCQLVGSSNWTNSTLSMFSQW